MNRRRKSAHWIFGLLIAALPTTTIAACGSRTDLDAPADDEESNDASMPSDDVSTPTIDASPRRDGSSRDGSSPRDASSDALLDHGIDAPIEIIDAGPPIPGIDASFDPDSGTICADGGDAIAYLVAESGAFYTFDPSTITTHLLGTINCPASVNASPFTMTVSQGGAFVLYSDGTLFRVDLNSLACTATSYVDGQLGFPSDIGIATSRGSGSEGLLIYGCIENDAESCVPTLAKSDLMTFVLSEIGPLAPNPKAGYPVDVKEDAYGRLFACDGSGLLIEIDSATGTVLGEDATGLQVGPDLAVLTWNDQLFFFTQSVGTISTYDLTTKQLTTLGSAGDAIVGASAAPCIP